LKEKAEKRDFWPAPSSEPPIKGVELVPMRMDQLEDILVIERDSFPTPWSMDAFEYDLTQNDMAHYWVLVKDGEIIGYSGVWIIGNIAHLTTIAVCESFRGNDLGRWLLLTTMKYAGELGARRFTLEVRESNDPAIKLYESAGFRYVGRRENYYSEIGEDALVMWTGSPPYEC
jgi:[ribosomal protein S18]-alanine N-acetyltransferase